VVPIFKLDTEELWKEFLITRSDRLRDELVKRQMPFASGIAFRVASTVDTSICPPEDIQAAALAAMITCIDKFDEKVGYSEEIDRRFTGYARQRIHCACIDEFRMHCWINPRSNMAKKHGIQPVELKERRCDTRPLEDAIDCADISCIISSNQCQLSEDERFVLKSIYFHDMTQNEIAEILGLNSTAIGKRKHDGLNKIRHYIAKQKQDRLVAT
tara:strand:- start:5997 stop:6638 length:642 start_codon:yes stop_codon:yes gene_type:complete